MLNTITHQSFKAATERFPVENKCVETPIQVSMLINKIQTTERNGIQYGFGEIFQENCQEFLSKIKYHSDEKDKIVSVLFDKCKNDEVMAHLIRSPSQKAILIILESKNKLVYMKELDASEKSQAIIEYAKMAIL